MGPGNKGLIANVYNDSQDQPAQMRKFILDICCSHTESLNTASHFINAMTLVRLNGCTMSNLGHAMENMLSDICEQ